MKIHNLLQNKIVWKTKSYQSRPGKARSRAVRPERPPPAREEGGGAAFENAAEIAAIAGCGSRAAP